jgi:hypothetical protein
MLFKFKKKEAKKVTDYLSFYFYPDKQVVYFDEIIRMMKRYDLSVDDLTLYSNEYDLNDRHRVTFGVTGTVKNLRHFCEALQASKNAYFEETFKERL